MKLNFFRLGISAFLSAAFMFFGVLTASAASKPVVGSVSPTSATVGTPVTITASYSAGDSPISFCELYVEFENQGQMNLSNGVASLSYTFLSKGIYTVFVSCKDEAGNRGNGHNTAVDVSNPSGSSDSIAPTVGDIFPLSATKDVAVVLSASYADAGGVSTCRLIVDGFDQGAMTLSSGVASKSFTFDAKGSDSVYAQCIDFAGNITNGQAVTVVVSLADAVPPVVTPPPAVAVPGLIKLSCPDGAAVDNPCRSVYYRTSDGLRHAFPNEKVFFTWFADFSSVQEISGTAMAALPLGHNVTYRPGVRMVKFITDNKVYAVSRAGVLHWVSSESLAIALYGTDWNKKIDDISDVFVSNYPKGSDITKVSDYSPSAETAATMTIDTDF